MFSVEPITIDRRHIGVKLPILCEINQVARSPIWLYLILYAFLLYSELLLLVYIKSSSCTQKERLMKVIFEHLLTDQVRYFPSLALSFPNYFTLYFPAAVEIPYVLDNRLHIISSYTGTLDTPSVMTSS